jgi:hypothetical protein
MSSFAPGDVVEYNKGGLAVVHRMSPEFEGMVEVNWVVVPPIKSRRNNGGWCVRDEHPEYDMRTLASKFNKLWSVHDADVQ